MHDEPVNEPASSESSQQAAFEEYMKSLPEEERMKIIQAQQYRSTGCILFTQIFSGEQKDVLGSIVQAFPNDHAQTVYDKIFATVMMHCFKTASEDDLSTVRQGLLSDSHQS